MKVSYVDRVSSRTGKPEARNQLRADLLSFFSPNLAGRMLQGAMLRLFLISEGAVCG
jgi:hypothetical protein